MPAISVFYGLVVYMYFLDNKRHKLPHIHVTYQSEEAVASIADGSVLEGSIPNARMKLLQARIELHKEELATNWSLASSGQTPRKIPPLR